MMVVTKYVIGVGLTQSDPTPNPHQQRSQAHSADSPKYQGGEKMQNAGLKDQVFSAQNKIHRLVWYYPIPGRTALSGGVWV